MKLRVRMLPFVLFAAGLLSQILVSSSSLSTQTTSPVPDFDGNGLVDFSDFVGFAGAYGAREGDEAYETKYDLNADGEVGFDDFVKFANSFGEEANRAPVFATTTPVLRSVEENTPAGRAVGDPISATDADGDSLTYKLRGLDAESFSVDIVDGQLLTKEGIAYDHEAKDSYSVTVGVSDGRGGSASVDVGIAVTNVEEPHAGPPSQIVVISGDSALTVRWNASSDETGKPPVSGYEVAHRQGDNGDWQESQILKSRTDTSLTLNGLINDQVYQIRVRTLNDEGASGWSPASGVPVAPKGQDPPPSSQGGTPHPRQQGNSPDLVVGTPSVSESSLDVGDSFTLSATVSNQGSGTSLATTLRYYLSTDGTISDSDTEVGTDAVSVLAALGTSDQSIGLTAPSDAGTYYYGACVDAVTGESSSGNNCSGAVQATVSVGSPTPPQVTISAGTTPVTEGTAATFTITVSSAPTSALTVNVDVSEDGDVISGTPAATIIINANNTTAILIVNTLNDQADESNSVISAEVETGTGYTVGSTSSASVTVNDNDPPQMTISAGTTPVTEGTAATFTITASSAPTSALAVNVTVTHSGDLVSGTPPSIVTIDAGKTTATLTVATDDDEVIELHGRVTAEVQTGTGYTVGSPSSANVIVENDDVWAPVASVVIDPDSLAFTAVGGITTLTAHFFDADNNETSPTSWGWSSANEEVATVSSRIFGSTSTQKKASVRANGAGTTTVTLGASGGGGTATGRATVTVTVIGRRVVISPSSLTFNSLGETKSVTVRVLDEDDEEDTEALFSTFLFFSPRNGGKIGQGGLSFENVDGGIEITANETGSGNVSISSADAEKAILLLRVYQDPASLTVSPDSVSLAVGGTTTLSAAIQDANGHSIRVDQGDGDGGLVVYWETSDSAVATVDGADDREDRNTGGTATVTAAGAGTATITGRWGGRRVVGTSTITVTNN